MRLDPPPPPPPTLRPPPFPPPPLPPPPPTLPPRNPSAAAAADEEDADGERRTRRHTTYSGWHSGVKNCLTNDSHKNENTPPTLQDRQHSSAGRGGVRSGAVAVVDPGGCVVIIEHAAIRTNCSTVYIRVRSSLSKQPHRRPPNRPFIERSHAAFRPVPVGDILPPSSDVPYRLRSLSWCSSQR